MEKPQALAAFPHADDSAVWESKRGFSSPLNDVLKINELNYLLNTVVVSDSDSKCACQPEFCFRQMKLDFHTNFIKAQKGWGVFQKLTKQDATATLGFILESK